MRFDRLRLLRSARRLAAAAPGAFRHDPVFRYAAIGAIVSLLVVVARLTGGLEQTGPRAPEPPTSGALGSRYGERRAPGPAPAAPPSPAPSIAPGRTLDGIRIAPETAAPADRFGTLPAPKPDRP